MATAEPTASLGSKVFRCGRTWPRSGTARRPFHCHMRADAQNWSPGAGLQRTDVSAPYLLYKRYLEDPFAALAKIRPSLFRGGDILDTGANIAYTASLFARAGGPIRGCSPQNQSRSTSGYYRAHAKHE